MVHLRYDVSEDKHEKDKYGDDSQGNSGGVEKQRAPGMNEDWIRFF